MAESTQQTLLHTCARAATAAESKFRIDYPNSRSRSSKIIALDEGAAEIMASVSEKPWNEALFFTVKDDHESASNDLRLQRPDGSKSRLSDEIADADVIVMLSTTVKGRDAAEMIGQMARRRSIMTAGLVLNDGSGVRVSDEVIQAFRPFASVLVVGTDADYLPAMLTALRA